MISKPKLGIRWTIGSVSRYGFEALRLSIWGAWKVFGPEAAYAVCVHSLPLDQAQAWTGPIPEAVRWHDVTDQISPLVRAQRTFGPVLGSSPRSVLRERLTRGFGAFPAIRSERSASSRLDRPSGDPLL